MKTVIEISRAAGEILAYLTAGIKIGAVHLRLDSAGNYAEFIWRAKIGDRLVGQESRVSFLELHSLSDLEGLAHRILAAWLAAAKKAGA